MGITSTLTSNRKAVLIFSPVIYLTATELFSAYSFSYTYFPKNIYLYFSKNHQVVNHSIWFAFHDGNLALFIAPDFMDDIIPISQIVCQKIIPMQLSSDLYVHN